MSIDNQKIITTAYIDALLDRLYKWMPFKRKNGGIVQDSLDSEGNNTNQVSNQGEIALGNYNKTNTDTVLSVGVGNSDADRRNALEIRKDGMIYIITDLKTNSIESLQNTLAKKGTSICTTYDEISYYISKDNKIRKLTPRECLRLMGFDDRFKIVVSDTQMYKQAGNSIVSNNFIEILKQLDMSMFEEENNE